jgi:hypothetical protein
MLTANENRAEDLALSIRKIPCPSCGSETIRHADKDLNFTGKRCYMRFLTCAQMPFYYIPSAQDIEEAARILAPLHVANLEGGSR